MSTAGTTTACLTSGSCYARSSTSTRTPEARHLQRHPPRRAARERDPRRKRQDRLCRQVRHGEHPRFLPRDHIEKIVRRSPLRPAQRTSFSCPPTHSAFYRLHPDPGADQVLLPVRLHREARRYRAGITESPPSLLRLLRPGPLEAPSDQVREELVRKWKRRREAYLVFTGWNGGQAYLHQGHRGIIDAISPAPSVGSTPERSRTLTLGFLPSFPALTAASSTRATPTPTLPNGRRRHRTLASPLREELRQIRRQRGKYTRRSSRQAKKA